MTLGTAADLAYMLVFLWLQVLAGLVRWCYGMPVRVEAGQLVGLWALGHQYDMQVCSPCAIDFT